MTMETINPTEVNTDILTMSTFAPTLNDDGTVNETATMESLENRAQANELIGGLCKCDNACLLAYAEDNEYYKARGCDTLDEYADKFLHIGATQSRLYRRVVEKYGVINEDGTYSIERKFAICGPDKLDIIARHPQFNGKDDFVTVLQGIGATPKTSNAKLTELIKAAKGGNDKPKTEKAKTKDKATATLERNVVELANKVGDLKDVCSKLYLNAMKPTKELSDKDFRKLVIDLLKEAEIKLVQNIEPETKESDNKENK